MYKNNKAKQFGIYLLLSLVVLLIFVPVLTMISGAFKTPQDIYITTQIIPAHPTLTNFQFVIQKSNFIRNMINSLVVACSVTITATIVASFAGYALSRFRGKLFGIFQSFLLILYIFPGMLAMIPLFRIFSSLGLLDRLSSIIVIYLTGNLPFSIWMSKGFFDGIPFDIEEAAMIEGVSQFRAFLKVVLPISTPGLAAVGIFCFINSWNEYMQASIFLKQDAVKTITTGIRMFESQFSADWGPMLAAAAMATVPVALFLIFAQKYIVAGLTAGAVKG